LPTTRRIVVAIDPAVTSGEDSDETGIIVAGVGADGRGYILEDRSGKYTPDEWSRQAIIAYYKWKADRVIAEVNNGGDLVEAVLRTIDANVAFKAVHASRGKVARAEPTAALYEQRRSLMSACSASWRTKWSRLRLTCRGKRFSRSG
jgi:predicted phage terminase large subunit-like protein